jgi:hypothetical protein
VVAGKSRGALPEPVPINDMPTSTAFWKVLVDFSNVFEAFLRAGWCDDSEPIWLTLLVLDHCLLGRAYFFILGLDFTILACIFLVISCNYEKTIVRLVSMLLYCIVVHFRLILLEAFSDN